MFTCETRGAFSGFLVNGTEPDLIPPEIRRDLDISESLTAEATTVQTLTLQARSDYNGTVFQCVALTLSGSAGSENVTLHIQGMYIPSYVLCTHNHAGRYLYISSYFSCVFQYSDFLFSQVYCQQ